MSYPVLNRSEARRRLEGDGGEETVKPLGPDVDWIASAALLRAKLAKLQASIGDPKTDHGSRRFDSAASRIVHQSMLLHPALADAEFWIWLTVTHFKTLIQWRYGEGADLKNYGIGGSTENFLYRLWLRGDIGHVGDAKTLRSWSKWATSTFGEVKSSSGRATLRDERSLLRSSGSNFLT